MESPFATPPTGKALLRGLGIGAETANQATRALNLCLLKLGQLKPGWGR